MFTPNLIIGQSKAEVQEIPKEGVTGVTGVQELQNGTADRILPPYDEDFEQQAVVGIQYMSLLIPIL
jgi:hypothetical protein